MCPLRLNRRRSVRRSTTGQRVGLRGGSKAFKASFSLFIEFLITWLQLLKPDLRPSVLLRANKTPETLRQHVPHSLNQSSQSGHKTNRERSRQSNRQSQDATVHTDPTTVLMPSLAFSTKERSVFLSTACQTGNGFSLTFWAATSRSDKNIQLILKQSLNSEGQSVHDNTLFHVKSV